MEKERYYLEFNRDEIPSLARVIVETQGGREWFADSLTGLRAILFGKSKINNKAP